MLVSSNSVSGINLLNGSPEIKAAYLDKMLWHL